MSEEDCRHGLDARWCSVCIHGVSKPEAPSTIIATFRSRYPGDCGGCRTPFGVGELIHWLSNETYVHVGCQP